MNGLSHIQSEDAGPDPADKDSPFRLVEAGGGGSMATGTQLLSPEGSSCPELWNRAEALFNSAVKEKDKAEHHRMLLDAGEAFCQVVMAPGHFPVEKSFALNNIGLIVQGLNNLDAAEKAFAFALQMNPKHGSIMQNFATVRMLKGELKSADEWFYKALERNPHCAEARWNSALIALVFGDFRRGFINYEWRWRCSAFTWRPLKTKRPQWNGQDLKGKTILLTHEQGFGDSIMAIRYAKMVKALGPAKVRYLCLPELICILKDVEGIDSVTEYADMNRDGSAGDEDFDYHCPLLSLPRIFKTRVKTVPWDGPYVRVNAERGTRNVEGNGKLKVGVVWAGRAEHANDKNRSIGLDTLLPLFDPELQVDWYSLQVGERAKDTDSVMCDWIRSIYAPPLKTFLDTAWWLNELDLLISVDTAVVHLAGAMGRPVWTLLPVFGDWRWMMDREDSPWYPTMRLFRQKTKGDWAEVIGRVISNLKSKISERETI